MTKLFFLSLFLIVVSAQAAELSCPEGSTVVLSCTEATQPGDFEVAVAFMNGAVICQDAGGLSMYMSTADSPELSPPVPVKEVVNPGATNYIAHDEDVEFDLVRILIPGDVNGKFNILVNGSTIFRSLSCK